MRVFSCKSYCPFICSTKSSIHLDSPCLLKLEDAQNASSSPPPVSRDSDVISSQEAVIANKEEILLKSSLKKSRDMGSGNVRKERVKWMDHLGKELVEIREFEVIDSGDLEDNGDGHPSCICVIQ